jgi:hypothetical protein
LSRKAQNSFLVLTTLGVYLGLLMVGGAAPQVLAHSATTRVFEITDEIEVKDDLDNKPDADAVVEQFAKSLEDIYLAAAEISSENPEGVASSQYDFHNFVTVFRNGGSRFVSNPEFNGGLRTFSGRYSRALRDLYDVFLPRSEDFHEKLRIDFRLTSSDLEFRANFVAAGEAVAEEIGSSLVRALQSRKERELEVRRTLIYSETKIDVDGDHVLVVTRLPRAGLDALLAKDAKVAASPIL